MPTKPTKEAIEAAKKKLDGREVLQVIINETPELKASLVEAGILKGD